MLQLIALAFVAIMSLAGCGSGLKCDVRYSQNPETGEWTVSGGCEFPEHKHDQPK